MTPYKDINELISTLTERVVSVFGGQVVGGYLFGSLSYHDFKPESSDIDLMYVLAHQATPTEIEELKKLHVQIGIKFPKWANRMEVSYTPMQMLTNLTPPGDRPYYGEGKFYEDATYGNEWIINLYLVGKYGITVFGKSASELIGEIDIDEARKASRADLYREWEPKLRDVEWLNNGHYQSYLVLNLCRIMSTVMAGIVGSKTVASDWVKTEFPEWKSLIDESKAWVYGVEMKRQEEALDFLKFVLGKIPDSDSG